ncbi:DNA-binding domain-containing protein [Methylocaldum sp.]|uniref:HvfC family RiPP maturation protein n=1 Tax=Methylocaldum sp. TaxID=1969727 RepID=UPI002D263E6E|nr:putative DNA-binding domain-containing protein [Methylocaldum sp.]HYE34214.1 putative DNA-binding domain-containing protein [Methylocaldum sp.]
MAEEIPLFQRTQYAFAAYIRDPNRNPLPRGPAPERMGVYRELFFNNIENFLATGFPVLKSILSETQWLALVQDFYAGHQSRTPYFAGIAEEFLDYLQSERDHYSDDPPYLLELAHYEWTELALAIAEGEAPPESADLRRSPMDQTVYLSEVAWPLAYRFPVHKIGPEHQPPEPPEQLTCLVVYRDREDVVKFLEITPLTYRLLQILQEEEAMPAIDCLFRMAKEMGHPDPRVLAGHGAEILRALAERGVIGAS